MIGLYRDYRCYIVDYYKNPEYLNKVLMEILGESRIVVVELIKKRLEKFALEKPIEEFLIKLGK